MLKIVGIVAASLLASAVAALAQGLGGGGPGPTPPPSPWVYAAPSIYAPAGSCVTLPQNVTGGCPAGNSININGGYYVSGNVLLPIATVSSPLSFAGNALTCPTCITSAATSLTLANGTPTAGGLGFKTAGGVRDALIYESPGGNLLAQIGISGAFAVVDQNSNFLLTILGPLPQSNGGTTGGNGLTLSSSVGMVGDENWTVSGTPSLDVGLQVGWNYKVGATTAQVRYTIQGGDTLSSVTAGIVAAAKANATLASIINGIGANGNYINGIATIVQESAGVAGFDVINTADPTLGGNGWTAVSSANVTIAVTPVGYYFGGPSINIFSGVLGRDSIVGDIIYTETVSYPNSSGVNATYQINTYEVLNAASPSLETCWTTGGGGYCWNVGNGRASFNAINEDLGLVANSSSTNNVIIASGLAGDILLNAGTAGVQIPNEISLTFQNSSNIADAAANEGANGVLFVTLGTVNKLQFSLNNGSAFWDYNVTSAGVITSTKPETIPGLTVTTLFTATGLVTNGDLANPSTTVNGQTCTLGSACTVTAAATAITVGTTTIASGTPNGLLYDNGGSFGNLATANNGVLVTSSGGVPSISSTLPSGLSAPSFTVTTVFTATGLVTNADLANSTISGVALGSNLATLTYGTHLTNSSGASSYNGSAASTLATDATSANTASTIVARDGSGNFTAGTVTASLTGHASLDLALTGGTMSGNIAMGGNAITGGGAITGTVLTASSLATGGCTIGSQAFCETGAASLNGVETILSGGNIGFGTETNPQSAFVFSKNTTTSLATPAGAVGILGYGTDSSGFGYTAVTYGGTPTNNFYRYDGTAASPLTIQASGESLGNINFLGWNGAAFKSAAQIGAVSTQQFTGSVSGASLAFFTTANSANTKAVAMTIAAGVIIGNGSTDPGAGQIAVTAMTQTAAAQSGTVCYSTTIGALTYDATLGCLTSLEEMKDIHGPITGALAEVEKMRPFWFKPKDRPAGSDLAEQPGFGAHQIEAIDPRLVGYGEDGKLRGVRYMEMTAVLAAAIKELKADNDNLRAELRHVAH
jgi:hypothetical protein